MKRLYIAIGMIVLCISIGIFETVSIIKTTENCIANIKKADTYIKNDNIEKAYNVCRKNEDEYKNITGNFIYCYYPHTTLEEIGFNMRVMTENLNNRDIKRYKSVKEKTKKQLSAIKEEELFTIQNIL